MTIVELAAVAGFITAVVGALVTLTKLSGERHGIRITNEQGAATIYDNLVRTLQAEVTRLNEVIIQKDTRIRELEKENEGFRGRFGTRADDSSSS